MLIWSQERIPTSSFGWEFQHKVFGDILVRVNADTDADMEPRENSYIEFRVRMMLMLIKLTELGCWCWCWCWCWHPPPEKWRGSRGSTGRAAPTSINVTAKGRVPKRKKEKSMVLGGGSQSFRDNQTIVSDSFPSAWQCSHFLHFSGTLQVARVHSLWSLQSCLEKNVWNVKYFHQNELANEIQIDVCTW